LFDAEHPGQPDQRAVVGEDADDMGEIKEEVPELQPA